MSLQKYDEYNEIIEALLKATGNFEVFDTFENKLKERNCTPEQLRKNILILTTLSEAIKNQDLKLELYEKIIQEIVLYLFKVEIHGTD